MILFGEWRKMIGEVMNWIDTRSVNFRLKGGENGLAANEGRTVSVVLARGLK